MCSSPHRPYEGLQRQDDAAEERAHDGVLIAPTRDCNDPKTPGGPSRHRPHRPYEGLQPRRFGPAFLRGHGPHRPYEGLQRDDPGGLCRAYLGVLIAPTRDCNPGTDRAQEGCRDVSSSPLRGIATVPSVRWLPSLFSSPHRPYEGLQLDIPPMKVPDLLVLIAPTRDCNGNRPVSCVIIRRSSSPLRGIATWRARRRAASSVSSSSPLRGIATRPGRAGASRARRVLIAPTRDCNHIRPHM